MGKWEKKTWLHKEVKKIVGVSLQKIKLNCFLLQKAFSRNIRSRRKGKLEKPEIFLCQKKKGKESKVERGSEDCQDSMRKKC